MDAHQTMRFSQGELDLIKQVFGQRPDVVLLLRNHFLQLGVSEEERQVLKGLSPEIFAVLRKGLIPDLEKDVPLNQQATLYSRLAIIEQIHAESAILHIEANDMIVEYLQQQFESLTIEKEPSIILQSLRQPLGVDQDDLRVANMIAYNNIIPIVDGRLNVLVTLANQKEETPEEKEKRNKANSSK